MQDEQQCGKMADDGENESPPVIRGTVNIGLKFLYMIS
jgi:hypothetical protein